jgi:uncharacterized protein YbaR (Trm112 family)
VFIELVDMLRCPRAHEETWLVAAVREMAGRHIRSGTLGCPICGSEYPIDEGVLRYDAAAPIPAVIQAELPSDDDVIRHAALLGLTGDAGAVVLAGMRALLGPRLAVVTGVQVLAVNPPNPAAAIGGGMSAILVDGPLPLAAGVLRGAALDAASRETPGADSVVRALRAGGRLVLPADVPLPQGVRELARDAIDVVAEREAAATRPVRLTINRAP